MTSSMLDEALRRLERAWLAEGGPAERALALQHTSSGAFASPETIHGRPELRAWFGWRAFDSQLCISVPTPGGVLRVRPVTPGGADWARLIRDAQASGFPRLVPVLTRFYLDDHDGSVWLRAWEGDDRLGFTPHAPSLAEFIWTIGTHYLARGRSSWQKFRIANELDSLCEASHETNTSPSVASRGIGALVVTAYPRRVSVRCGTAALKVGANKWLRTANHHWNGQTSDSSLHWPSWLRTFRTVLDAGVEEFLSDGQLNRLLKAHAFRGATVHEGTVRVWSQAPPRALMARLDAALRQFPSVHASLLPGAKGGDLRRVEDLIGACLPDDLRSLYEYANGQQAGSARLYEGYRWLPLREVERELVFLRSLRAARFGPEYWRDENLPILASPEGDLMYVDCAGRDAGIRRLVHVDQREPSVRRVLFGDLSDWVEAVVDAVEQDLLVFRDGGIHPAVPASLEAHFETYRRARFPWIRNLQLWRA